MLFKATQKLTYNQKAFTLLEVLVALAVLTMGLATVIKVAGSQASQLAYLKDKTIALWLANNKANEIRLDKWPATGTSNGHESMANQEWDWKLTVSNTMDIDLRRMDVEVKRTGEDGEPVVRFIAFVGKDDAKTVIP